MTELAGTETTSWVVKLEWPKEVGGLLEVWTDSVDLVDEILDTDDTVLAEVSLNKGVVGKSNALLVDLSVTTLVDKLAHGLEVWVTVGDPWLNDLEHLKGSLGHADKDTVVDLKETEKLEDLAWLRGDLVDTLDTDNEDQLGLSWDVVGTILLREAGKADLLTLLVTVLLDILLSTLEDDTTLLLLGSLLLLELSSALLTSLLLGLALLEESLWDENLLLGRDGAIISD